MGLRAGFADLTGLAAHLEREGADGYLALCEADGVLLGMALLLEGHLVAACSRAGGATSGQAPDAVLWGEPALVAFAQRFVGETVLEFCGLARNVVHALTGLGQRPFKVAPGDFFTGVRGHGDGKVSLYAEGAVIARLDADYRENGTLPASIRPPRLLLPRVIGAWATERYAFTLRGRDAVNPITDTYNRARAAHGKLALELLARLGRGQTPFEAAVSFERDVTELETMVEAFLREGLLRRRHDPVT
jgi:hypothetical protein